MAKKGSKTKQKQKQKQKQSQKVIVNVTQPIRRTVTTSKNAPQKSFLAQMPSFNINQPTPSPLTDLTKIIGLLVPRLQTESRLGSAIPTMKPPTELSPEPINIGGLTDLKSSPTLGDAIEAIRIKQEPELELNKPEKIQPSIKSYFKPIDEESEQEMEYASASTSSVPQRTPRISEIDRLNMRYEKAFGYPYSGERMKLKDFREIIQLQEAKNKTMQKEIESLKPPKRSYKKRED